MQNQPAAPGSGPGAWAEAQATLRRLIVQVSELHQHLVSGHQNLNWHGPSADYFQHQASDQDSYLNRNLQDLGSLLTMTMKAELDATVPHPGNASGGKP